MLTLLSISTITNNQYVCFRSFYNYLKFIYNFPLNIKDDMKITNDVRTH